MRMNQKINKGKGREGGREEGIRRGEREKEKREGKERGLGEEGTYIWRVMEGDAGGMEGGIGRKEEGNRNSKRGKDGG